jgi:hypothetical protein
MDSTTMNGCLPHATVHSHSCWGNEADRYALQDQGELLGPWARSFQGILTAKRQCFAEYLT